MFDPSKKFIPLPDRIILAKIQDVESQFLNGKKTITQVRQEISEFYTSATDADVKKFILMEYDGLELGAKRQVT